MTDDQRIAHDLARARMPLFPGDKLNPHPEHDAVLVLEPSASDKFWFRCNSCGARQAVSGMAVACAKQ